MRGRLPNYLGLVPARHPRRATAAPAARRRRRARSYSQTVSCASGHAIRLQVAAGPLFLQLTARASLADCGMTFRADPAPCYVDLPGERRDPSLAATVKAGSYPVTITCHTSKPKPFSLDATAMFAN